MIRTIQQHRRRCSRNGEREVGGTYLVSELSPDGMLPAIVLVGPISFVPPEDKPLGRLPIIINLDLLLEGAPYEDYIAGTSLERLQRERWLEPEEAAYGMPLERRRSIGICARHGMDCLKRLHPYSVRRLGADLRRLSRASNDKEINRALHAYAQSNWPQVLASLWRGWRSYGKKKRQRVHAPIAAAMISVGASDDAVALYR